MKTLEKQLTEALIYTGQPSLPAKQTDKPWYKAIALVLLMTGGHGYAVVRYNPGRKPVIVKSFGEEGVGKILEIYPYVDLESSHKGFDPIRNINFISIAYKVSPARLKALPADELQALYESLLVKEQMDRERIVIYAKMKEKEKEKEKEETKNKAAVIEGPSEIINE